MPRHSSKPRSGKAGQKDSKAPELKNSMGLGSPKQLGAGNVASYSERCSGPLDHRGRNGNTSVKGRGLGSQSGGPDNGSRAPPPSRASDGVQCVREKPRSPSSHPDRRSTTLNSAKRSNLERSSNSASNTKAEPKGITGTRAAKQDRSDTEPSGPRTLWPPKELRGESTHGFVVGKYPCLLFKCCDVRFETTAERSEHMEAKFGDKIKCIACGNTFKTQDSATNHISNPCAPHARTVLLANGPLWLLPKNLKRLKKPERWDPDYERICKARKARGLDEKQD